MSELYHNDSFFWSYAKWHYGKGVRELVLVAQNFLWFIKHFFSFRLLFRTLFAPWKRMSENYGDSFDLNKFFSALVVNTLMRVVGFMTRMIVLVVGFASYLATLAFFLGVFVLWLLAPAITLGTLVLSVTFFIL